MFGSFNKFGNTIAQKSEKLIKINDDNFSSCYINLDQSKFIRVFIQDDKLIGQFTVPILMTLFLGRS